MENKILFMGIHNDKSKNHCVFLLYEIVSILLYVRRCNCGVLPSDFGINWNLYSCLVGQQISD